MTENIITIEDLLKIIKGEKYIKINDDLISLDNQILNYVRHAEIIELQVDKKNNWINLVIE